MLTADQWHRRLARRGWLMSLVVVLMLTAAGPGLSASREVGVPPPSVAPSLATPDESDGEPGRSVPYELTIVGLEDSALETLLTQVSQLAALQSRPPASLAGLRRRAEDDLERFRQALRSEGFYASRIDFRIETGAPDRSDDAEADSDEPEEREVGDAPPPGSARVIVEVEAGDLILLEDYRVEYQGAPPPSAELPLGLADLGLELGMPARAPEIVAAEARLERALKEGGHPLARILDRKAVVDYALGTMSVTVQADAGPPADFGPTRFVGLERVEEDYLQEILPWRSGERFDQRQVDAARLRLARTALFDSVVFEPAEALDDQGRLPMTIRVVEADHRSIGAGVSFSTDLGPGGEAFWEHRNLLGRNEQLRLALRGSTVEQGTDAEFRKPRFLAPGQSLLGSLALVQSDTDAFEQTSVRAFAGLERSIAAIWTVNAGVSAEFADLEDEDGQRTFIIYDAPLGIARDGSDDLLNPTRGTKLGLSVTPAVGTLEENVFFVTTNLTGSAYLKLDEAARVILAARGRIGSVVGEATDILPANRRLYAGGGGSVRGFAFQEVGPLDDDDDPLGGRSVIELGGEVRLRVTEDIGVVPFVEGGIVGDTPLPDFEERFLWAIGLGLRYFTAVGPLRLDVAFPVNGRDSDDFFQFYVSLGQAF